MVTQSAKIQRRRRMISELSKEDISTETIISNNQKEDKRV
jgi:hypothetical protein